MLPMTSAMIGAFGHQAANATFDRRTFLGKRLSSRAGIYELKPHDAAKSVSGEPEGFSTA